MMTKTKTKVGGERLFSLPLAGFPTIGRTRQIPGVDGAEQAVNFRITAEGALEKRCGSVSALTLPTPPRAVYVGYLAGERVLYLLAGRTVYRYCADDEYGYVTAGQVETTAGEAAFVELSGSLLLLDGDDVYLLSEDGRFESVEGYIPLYGRNWNANLRGEICEQENYLTPRVRLHYYNDKAYDTLYFGRRVLSIHKLLLDGVDTAKTEVELTSTGLACIGEILRTAKEIELVVTLDTKNVRKTIASAHRAIAYGGAEDNRLLLWDADDRNALYASRVVRRGDAARSDKLGNTTGGALYFPIGEEDHRVDAPVTAVCRYGERLLVFTASGTWSAAFSGGSLLVTPLHSTIGCDKRDCAVLVGNSPVSLCGGVLWRWDLRPSSERECNAVALSAPVSEHTRPLGEAAQVSMQYYPATSELLVSEAGNPYGRVLVYSTEADGFYVYEGLYSDRFVETGGMPAFFSGAELLYLDPAATCDAGERTIHAFYESGRLDLDRPFDEKRLVKLALLADPNGEELIVRVENDRGRAAAFAAAGRGDGAPRLYERRVSLGRSRCYRFSLASCGDARPTVSALCFTARK